MQTFSLPYGHSNKQLCLNEQRINGVLVSGIHHYTPQASETELVRRAMLSPVGSPRLCELARGKKNIVLIASDHTRPVPSKVIIPLMLNEIREGNPDADITILIATGCHRETTRDELVSKFGEDIVAKEKIVVSKVEFSEEKKEELNRKLLQVHKNDMVTVVYFCKDEYLQMEGRVSRIDKDMRILKVVNTKIAFSDIYDVWGSNILEEY